MILLTTSIVGIAANIFVLLAVYHQKSLQTSNNALVVNLAIIDILRCVIDCPILFTIVTAVHQKREVGKFICDAQVTSFSFSCCIQLLTLACISAERYQAISQPFKTSQRRKRITVLIPLTWTLAILMAVVCLIFVKDSPVYMRCTGPQRGTPLSYDTFGLYMLFPLWAACFGIIIGFYARIFHLVRSHNRKIFDKGVFTLSMKTKTDDKQKREEIVENEKSVQNLTLNKNIAQVKLVTQVEPNSSKAAQYASSSESEKKLKNAVDIRDLETEQPCPPVIQDAVQPEEKPFIKMEQSNVCLTRAEEKPNVCTVVSSESSNAKVSNNCHTESQPDKEPTEIKESSPQVNSPAQIEDPGTTAVLMTEPRQAKKNNGGETVAVSTMDQVPSLHALSAQTPETEAPIQNTEAEGAVCMMPSKSNKERANKKKEGKLAKRAGYIIVTFLLFWLPLITTILVNYVVHKNNYMQVSVCRTKDVVVTSLLWVKIAKLFFCLELNIGFFN